MQTRIEKRKYIVPKLRIVALLCAQKPVMENYFEFYGLTESFHPDPVEVKAKYYELSRRYHPDRFAQQETGRRVEALTMAALNNKVYKTLSDPDATMAYILRAAGVLEEEEKYNLPPDFLMEMLDLNDQVSDYEQEPTNEALRKQLSEAMNAHFSDWNDEATMLTRCYNAGEKDKKLLVQIKDMYFRKKYLLRIQERINKFAAR